MDFLNKNLKWIVLIFIVIIGSNLLTGIKFNSLSKKDRRLWKKQLDSLNLRYKQLEFVHITEAENRRKIFLEDSLIKINYQKQAQKDAALIAKQNQTIHKYTKLTSKVNLSKLDSAYEAENK
jgi:hypothetical protein